MALFFDTSWLDARLRARGLDHAAFAAAAGLNERELEQVLKDQRPLAAHEVRAVAALLQADPAETAKRCGVAWLGAENEPEDRIAAFEARLDAVERWIAEFEQGRAV